MINNFKKDEDNTSNNAAKIAEWKDEHYQIITLFEDVLSSYKDNDIELAKTFLAKANQVALRHIIDEDITLTKLLKISKQNDRKIVEQIKEFLFSFTEIKESLINFLTKYNTLSSDFDDDFLLTLETIIKSLKKRIEYEEKNLYNQINH